MRTGGNGNCGAAILTQSTLARPHRLSTLTVPTDMIGVIGVIGVRKAPLVTYSGCSTISAVPEPAWLIPRFCKPKGRSSVSKGTNRLESPVVLKMLGMPAFVLLLVVFPLCPLAAEVIDVLLS